ncbi:MAG: CHASE2 domain-containing protein [Cyanophyceae cyanobacterium]
MSRYQVGGSLASNAPCYVVRKADTELYQALQQGEFCVVLNSRQVGKSSLLVRTKHRLEQAGYCCWAIDFTNIGSEHITPLQWYKGIVAELWSGFGLTGINLKSWWQEQELSYVQRLSQFIELLLAQFPTQNLIIFIDEVDSILSLDFPVDDFFAFLRFCYSQRSLNPVYRRITFAIFGVATPANLIRDKRRTPFNIGRAIALEGFQLDEVEPLLAGLTLVPGNPRTVIQEILRWTGGQPFLTQKLCQLVVSSQDAISGKLTLLPKTEALWVEHIVRTGILENWEFQDEPEHLRTIRDRLLYSEDRAGRLLGIYQRLLSAASSSVADESRDRLELLLSGLVVERQGQLMIKNPIYRAIFNAEWVAIQLEKLRPYASNIDAWLASGQETHLLRGLALQQALAWAKTKQLADADYRFLGASQERARQQAEHSLAIAEGEREQAVFALQAARQAHVLLAQARQRAKRVKARLHPVWNIAMAIAASCIIALLRWLGWLQGAELAMLDTFFRQRSPAPVTPRITLITIDETDIRRTGQPLSDRILAQALRQLKQYEPRAIGLNLYRDLPVQPGHAELVQVLQSTPHLVGIEKRVGTKIVPPPSAPQVGFADLLLDPDGTVRRALLSVRTPANELRYSFALQLALEHLAAEGITPQPRNDQIRLGKAELSPLQANDGGYVRADTGGYQVLLNYRGTIEQFQSFSLTELLANQIPPSALRDHTVLIGATTATLSSKLPTPFGSRTNRAAPVIIHANILSQLLSAALDGRPLLRPQPKHQEWLWITLWIALGALLSWRWRSLVLKAIAALAVLAALVFFAYLAFLQGWWLPLVPPALGIVVAATAIHLLEQKRLAKEQLRQTIAALWAIAHSQPAVAQIALEYLKQSEPENRAFIEAIARNYPDTVS